ncbi:hypothetical protein SBRY_10914 [Actinacidiphila bryophytorum]|uniref:Uncharacterized protein n=1 Tax=Actinacidiphila bryophytorum TaxID=1436133 RepID=A0A9W4E728_9ACTN|nr:hypothetical protein SBRY_10914 [Actinacidiphila bryophytorum]
MGAVGDRRGRHRRGEPGRRAGPHHRDRGRHDPARTDQQRPHHTADQLQLHQHRARLRPRPGHHRRPAARQKRRQTRLSPGAQPRPRSTPLRPRRSRRPSHGRRAGLRPARVTPACGPASSPHPPPPTSQEDPRVRTRVRPSATARQKVGAGLHRGRGPDRRCAGRHLAGVTGGRLAALRHLPVRRHPLRGRAQHDPRAVQLLQRLAVPGAAGEGQRDAEHRGAEHRRLRRRRRAGLLLLRHQLRDHGHLRPVGPRQQPHPGPGRRCGGRPRQPGQRHRGTDHGRRPQGLRRLRRPRHRLPQRPHQRYRHR